VLGVIPAEGVSEAEAVAAINEHDQRLDALTRADAADKTPGVAQVRQSFQIIFALYGFVVPLVTGLFFLIVTVQKARALTLLRAVGVSGRRLVGSLLIQVLLVIGAGTAIGIVLFAPLVALDATSLSLRFDTRAVAGWAIALLVLGALSSIIAARRVMAIDPVTAATAGGAA
jgi:putative ABC transport system permease protein